MVWPTLGSRTAKEHNRTECSKLIVSLAKVGLLLAETVELKHTADIMETAE